MDKLPNRTTSLALMALGVVAALTCVSAIGAATTLVFMALDKSEPTVPMATYDGSCAVVVWQSGTTHCFRTASDGVQKLLRRESAVVAQVEPAR